MHPLDTPAVPFVDSFGDEIKALESRLAALHQQRNEARRIHLERHQRLIYSAHSRCKCGAGLAYLNTAGPLGSWECSAALKGESAPGAAHSEPLPFTFYEVKSETQPDAIAAGATTRPRPT